MRLSLTLAVVALCFGLSMQAGHGGQGSGMMGSGNMDGGYGMDNNGYGNQGQDGMMKKKGGRGCGCGGGQQKDGMKDMMMMMMMQGMQGGGMNPMMMMMMMDKMKGMSGGMGGGDECCCPGEDKGGDHGDQQKQQEKPPKPKLYLPCMIEDNRGGRVERACPMARGEESECRIGPVVHEKDDDRWEVSFCSAPCALSEKDLHDFYMLLKALRLNEGDRRRVMDGDMPEMMMDGATRFFVSMLVEYVRDNLRSCLTMGGGGMGNGGMGGGMGNGGMGGGN